MGISMRYLSIVLVLLLLAATAEGESKIKQAIFEDCEKAKQDFAILDESGKKGLFDYLTRVVALNTQSPAVAEAFAILPGPHTGSDPRIPGGGKGPEPAIGNLWQTIDAKRELRGKNCALEIFSLAGPSAVHAILPLAVIYKDQALSDEIAVALEETVANVAEQAHRAGFSPSDSELDTLVPHLTEARPLVAQNTLTEYLVIALPRILAYLAKAADSDREPIVRFLRSNDPDGSRGMRAFIELAPSLAKEDAIQLASILPFPSKEAIPPLLKDIAMLAVGIESTSIFAPLLGRSCQLVGKLPSEVSQIISPFPILLRQPALDINSRRCLVASSPTLARTVPAMVLSLDNEESQRGLQLLPSALAACDSETRNNLFSHLRGLASRTSPLQTISIEHLSLFPERRSEAIAFFSQILSRSGKADISPAVRQLVFTVLASMDLGKDAHKLREITRQALQEEAPAVAVYEVAKKIQLPTPYLTPLISAANPNRSVKALELLAERPLDKKYLPLFIDLSHSMLGSEELEKVLLSYGKGLAPALRRSLTKLNGAQRIEALALLQRTSVASKQESSELFDLLLASSCQVLGINSRHVLAIIQRSEVSTGALQELGRKMQGCLGEISPRVAIEWIQAAPRIVMQSPHDINQSLSSGTIPEMTSSAMLDQAIARLVSPEVRDAMLEWAISKGPYLIQRKALDSIKGPDSPLIQSSIRRLASDSRSSAEIITVSRAALARSGDVTYDWSDFLHSVIERSGEGLEAPAELEIIRLLPPEVVLKEVRPALDSSSASKVVGACRVGSAMGGQAIPIVSKIWQLRERRTPSVRYAAVLALLEINPLTPDLHDHLRLLLVNRYFNHALTRAIEWRQSVAVVDLEKSSFGTLRTVHLERLLSSHRDPLVVTR